MKDLIIQDLSASGLDSTDIQARPLDMPERASCGLAHAAEGYVIPYFNLVGKPLPFYRAKLFNSEIKYKQLKGTPNHVYYPPTFLSALQTTGSKYIIITEGEKKAACATKYGFPAVAFGGVDSWRNRMLLLPQDTEYNAATHHKKMTIARLPSSTWDMPDVNIEPVAIGLPDLANLVLTNNLHVIIVYDSDETTTLTGMKPEVQKAASELGFELRQRGIPLNNIRQAILPLVDDDKTGLDDFLVHEDGIEQFNTLINSVMAKRSAFPQHPNMQQNLNKKLQAAKLSRKDVQKLSLGLISDMDSRGVRMFSKDEQQLYYFDATENKLLKVELSTSNERGVQNTPFAKLLYKRYGISLASDVRLMKWVSTQFAGEDPVLDVRPFRTIARTSTTDDSVRYQLNDGEYVKVTGDKKDPLKILTNGSENVLFEAEQVSGIDAKELQAEFKKRQEEPLKMWWHDVLKEVRLKEHGKTAVVIALLYYLSPWLHRWRGTQLPAELIIGEAGSGKSTLCELRLSILTGAANLRNAPSEFKDWHASIANTGGLHVTDNVQMADKALKQKLSDEICRLITEPEPHIEMRKYYTNMDLMSARVDAVFAFTAVAQPFSQSDLLQRCIKIELDKLAGKAQQNLDPAAAQQIKKASVAFDARWMINQLERFGGRTAWLSHHLYVLHKFFERVETSWDLSYKAKHRLINMEQAMMVLADIFEIDYAWLPSFLVDQTAEAVVEADWMLEGLSDFAQVARRNPVKLGARLGTNSTLAKECKFTSKDIATWAEMSEDFQGCDTLVNSRRLGRYLNNNKALIAQTAGLVDAGKYNNKTVYKIMPK